MISILIVDDNSEKISEIKQVLFEYAAIGNNITVASDANNGRRLIEQHKYDLLLLDLVLPNNFGDDSKPENGIEFLNEVALDPNKKCPYHIIGISGRPEYIPQYEKDFKEHLWYLIEYQGGIESWKEILRNKIEYLINSKADIQNLNDQKFDFDVAIITAIEKELSKVLQLDGNWKSTTLSNDSTVFYIGQFRKADKIIRVVAASSPQMGMCASSTLSMKLIHSFRPKYLIMSGIAAGIKGEVNLGDIMVADEVWDAGSGKVKTNEQKARLFLPDPKHKTLDVDLKEMILGLKQSRAYLDDIRNSFQGDTPSTVLKVHIGPMASVPAVIQNDKEIEEIQSHSRKLIGIEMESYGVFYAAAHASKPKPKAISIKSACDFANEEKDDSFQNYAAYTSTAYVHYLIMNHLDY